MRIAGVLLLFAGWSIVLAALALLASLPSPRAGFIFAGVGVEILGLVLSGGDFGRAYLAEAWATRFVCDLLDRYIVVLLGYSADDPPVRYLLEGLHVSGRIREQRLYGLGGRHPPVSVFRLHWCVL